MLVQLPLLLLVDAMLAADIAKQAAVHKISVEEMLSEMLAEAWASREPGVQPGEIPIGAPIFEIGDNARTTHPVVAPDSTLEPR